MATEREEFVSYVHDLGMQDTTKSRVLPLYSDEQIEAAVAQLKSMLEADAQPETQAALKSRIAQKIRDFAGHWFQRIDYPEHRLTSTSDHSLAYVDEGGINTLGKRLASEEASILRPWPKWFYIKPLVPDVTGKSVLEPGSSNGFFSFRFAELGARKVTGVEINRSQFESAVWSTSMLGHKNVAFINTDVLLDLTIPQHDIVFLSEVLNHFPVPFFGLIRTVNLAREMVILDTGAIDSDEHGIKLYSGFDKKTGRLIYSSFLLTDQLILDFLSLIGVEPSRVTRYKAPYDEYHILYKIDTRGLRATRASQRYPEYLEKFWNLNFITPASSDGLDVRRTAGPSPGPPSDQV
jgi:2-polyprenyl-3-methyl-5-hydroxy-6-metoxy-1,4-benzoquinol methylase